MPERVSVKMIFIVGGACQGKTKYAAEHFGGEYQMIGQYHEIVRQQMKEGKDPLAEAEKLCDGSLPLVVVSNEIGCGLVPVDSFQRSYRDMAGRVNCLLAKKADQVIRVICGVGTRIK